MTDQELKDLVASLAVQNKESGERFDREMKESREKSDKDMAEWKAQLQESREKSDRDLAEWKAQQKESSEKFDKLCKKVDKVCGKVGGIDDNIGYHAEQFFQDIFERKLELGGVKYDEFVPNLSHKTRKEGVEFDIAMFNGNAIALIEVKHRIHPNFVKQLTTERLEKFRKFFPEYNNYKIYFGIAGLSFCNETITQAKENGVALIKPKGENVEIESDLLKSY